MRRSVHQHLLWLAVLLCLQATAGMLAFRRDPADRFQAACLSGLVWESTRRLKRVADQAAIAPPPG